ncbi:MAG TPA: cobalamin-independent methionine synthase II family protein [Candidatus Binataceae bacterium]|nr:cobalamin-independent methionine synthase II family protein [Candidatus Binataceae bacterium]
MSESLLFPVTTVGSWSRQDWLVRALRSRQSGEMTGEDFNRIADDAVLAAIKYQEDAGVDIVSDGEMRRDNFYSFVVDKLNGMRLMKLSELLDFVKDRAGFEEILRGLDVPAFAIKSPIAIGKVSEHEHEGLATDEARFLKEHTTRKTKVPIPGPYLLTRSSWFEGLSEKAYPTREALAADIVQILRREIQRLKAIGVDFIQLDEPSLSQVVYGDEAEQTFMCAALGTRSDPADELEFAVRLMNETVEGIKGVRFGVHVCRGNWSRKEDVLLKGNYGPLLPWLMRMNVHQLVLEMATPRAGEIEVFKEYANQKEIGLGVSNPRTDEIEEPQQIVSQVKEVLKYFDPEKIYLNPDCGFGTFAERCVNTSDVAFRKLKAIAKAAEILREQYA